jgi:hypothetical protein
VTRRAALLCCCLSLTGCATQRPATRTVWLPAYGFGAFGGSELDVRDVCPSGAISELSVGSSWATLGISLITLGVYTPREAKVRCAPGR